MAVPHVAVYLRLRGERRHRVHDDHVYGAGPHEGLRDLQRLLAGVRLRDPELVDVDPEVPGIGGIKRMLRVDERGDAALLLRFRQRVKRQRRLAAGLRSVDLDDAAFWISAQTQGLVQQDGSAGYGLNARVVAAGAEFHERALSKLLLNLEPCRLDGLELLGVGVNNLSLLDGCLFCHVFPSRVRVVCRTSFRPRTVFLPPYYSLPVSSA